MFFQGCSAEDFLDTRKIFLLLQRVYIAFIKSIRSNHRQNTNPLTIFEIHFVKEHQKLRFVH